MVTKSYSIISWPVSVLVYIFLLFHRETDANCNLTTWQLQSRYEDPTPDEIQRGFSRPGWACWGQQMRKEGSIRLLMIGGSQTAYGNEADLSPMIHDHLKETYGPGSYALNRGRGSTAPRAFVGARYDFEEWDTSKWPNCVMMDFTLNTPATYGWNAARDAEMVVRSIKLKYLLKNITVPDFFLVEYLMTHGFQVDDETRHYNNSEEVLKRFNSLSDSPDDSFFVGNGFNRGCANCGALNELADFHGFPVISIRNVFFPAYLRNHLKEKHEPGHIVKHYMSQDGIHLWPDGRCLAMKHLYIPFFKKSMEPRVELLRRSKFSPIYEHDVSLFTPELLTMDLVRWSSWASHQNTLLDIVDTVRHKGNRSLVNAWHFRSTPGHEKDKEHVCYCSNVLKSHAVFSFDVPNNCTKEVPCEVWLSVIHSWNQTHFGDMNCRLFHNGADGRLQKVGAVAVTSGSHQGEKIRNTLPVDILLSRKVDHGHYVIMCANSDDRYSCISAVKVSQGFSY